MKRGIYGTGAYGKLLWGWCQELDIKIDFFAQLQEPVGSEIHGLKIYSVDDLLKMQDDLKILMAAGDIDEIREVTDMVSRSGREDIGLFDMKSFVEDNLVRNDQGSVTGEKYCMICGGNIEEFEPAGMKQELFKKHHIIGGGYRSGCICPQCGCNDRERWIYYVLSRHTDIPEMEGRILHFAPEKSISKFMRTNGKIDYYTGDLAYSRAMHVTDITDIQYKDETFDYVICNHVMEHIPDEAKAVSEIKRVMKKNGKWIFSFPVCTDMDTFENPRITSPEDRLKYYGQEDHVRLYGRDFKERFEGYGLKLRVFRPFEEFGRDDIDKYGFIEDDITIVAEKSV